jgi:hypothetical protein
MFAVVRLVLLDMTRSSSRKRAATVKENGRQSGYLG